MLKNNNSNTITIQEALQQKRKAKNDKRSFLNKRARAMKKARGRRK